MKIPNARLFSVHCIELPASPDLNLIFFFLFFSIFSGFISLMSSHYASHCFHILLQVLCTELAVFRLVSHISIYVSTLEWFWISFLSQITTDGILAPYWTCELYWRCLNIINLNYLKLVNHKMEIWLAATCEKLNSWPLACSFIKLNGKSINRELQRGNSIWIIPFTFLVCAKYTNLADSSSLIVHFWFVHATDWTILCMEWGRSSMAKKENLIPIRGEEIQVA